MNMCLPSDYQKWISEVVGARPYETLHTGLSTRVFIRVFDDFPWIGMIHRTSEDSQKWLIVNKWLHERGIPVPRVIRVISPFFLQLEDLGSYHLNDAFVQQDPLAPMYFREVLSQLSLLQSSPVPTWLHRVWDSQCAAKELSHTLSVWEAHMHTAGCCPSRCEQEWLAMLSTWDGLPRVLCHRDFHGENLMIYKNTIYWIDAQDMFWGPKGYDEASLIFDPYRSFESPVEFQGSVNVAIQRLLKCLGNYGVFLDNHRFRQATQRAQFHLLHLIDPYRSQFPETVRWLTSLKNLFASET